MKKRKKRNLKKEIINEAKKHKKAFIVYVVLRTFILITLILQLIRGNYENAFFCILTLILFLIPGFVEKKFNVEMPETLEIVIFLFIFAAEMLGEAQNFFNIFSHWDTILHTINGFLCAAIGFSLIDILNRTEKFHLDLSPFFVAFVGFCFSMTIGVFWEFIEFTMDTLFHTDMQKDIFLDSISSILLNPAGTNDAVTVGITSLSINGGEYDFAKYIDIGLTDTMKDLTVNFVGAFFSGVVGYFYAKGETKTGLFAGLMPHVKEERSTEKDKSL